MVSHFYQADADYGTRLAKLVNVDIAAVKAQHRPVTQEPTRSQGARIRRRAPFFSAHWTRS